jgi:arylsulfatase A-like enzyme
MLNVSPFLVAVVWMMMLWTPAYGAHRVILFVWDGLRADVISEEHTPRLYALQKEGVFFSDHHSSFPSVTMNNANSLATGDFAGQTGFYGNRSVRLDLLGQGGDFKKPILMKSNKLLMALDRPDQGNPLLFVETLMERAHIQGLKTVQIGKAGPAFLQGYRPDPAHSVIYTTELVFPQTWAKKLYQKGYWVPDEAVEQFQSSHEKPPLKPRDFPSVPSMPVLMSSVSGSLDQQGRGFKTTVSDPSVAREGLYSHMNAYFLDVYLHEVLVAQDPDFSVLWFSEPDHTEHRYGPGTAPFYAALKDQDILLGRLLDTLKATQRDRTTDILVVSDHGHSTTSGAVSDFPLRSIVQHVVGSLDPHGYAVSGLVHVADLLTQAGLHSYDNSHCRYNPILGGMQRDDHLIYPVRIDKTGEICGMGRGFAYTHRGYPVPEVLPDDAVIIANNGGSAYFYLPQHHQKTLETLVRVLQSRPEFDVILVDSRYGAVPGTLPLSALSLEGPAHHHRNPDVAVSMTYHAHTSVQGLQGIGYQTGSARSGHGSLSPADIHNVLIARGPDFKEHYIDPLPTGNVDVPVTIAAILKIPFLNRAGRPLLESVQHEQLGIDRVDLNDYALQYAVLQPIHTARGLTVGSVFDPTGHLVDEERSNYTFRLNTKTLSYRGQEYTYVDSGQALRY